MSCIAPAKRTAFGQTACLPVDFIKTARRPAIFLAGLLSTPLISYRLNASLGPTVQRPSTDECLLLIVELLTVCGRQTVA